MNKPSNVLPNDWKELQKKYKDVDSLMDKINNNYPVQYLIGNVDFYGYQVNVNKNVLIPRFETETLVEKTLFYIKDLKLENASVLEIGTGSGCISIALKKESPKLTISALDCSRLALLVAKKNARQNRVKINFIYKDMFNYDLINNYDILISNPPYIKEGEKIDPKTKYEPHNAIYGGKDGLKYYEQIFKIAKDNLNLKHLIALEIGEEQGNVLTKMAKKYFKEDVIKIEQDLAKKDRYLFIYSK